MIPVHHRSDVRAAQGLVARIRARSFYPPSPTNTPQGIALHERVARAGLKLAMAGCVYADPAAGAFITDAMIGEQAAHAAVLTEAYTDVADYWAWSLQLGASASALFHAGVGSDGHVVMLTSGPDFHAAFWALHADHPIYAAWASEAKAEADALDVRIKEDAERAARDFQAGAPQRALEAVESATAGARLCLTDAGDISIASDQVEHITPQMRADLIAHKAGVSSILAARVSSAVVILA